jgi:hypothetical protein
VRFVSVPYQIDTESPMGRAMFTILGAMVELESSLISEWATTHRSPDLSSLSICFNAYFPKTGVN